MLTPDRSRLRDETGFTLIEVTVVSAILLLVMAAFFSVLLTLTRTEQRTNALVSNEQDARLVLTAMARDIRAANHMNTFPVTADYVSRIQMDLGTPPAQTRVRWMYDINPTSPTYRSLLRQTIDPSSGAVLTSTKRLENIRNIERAVPVPMFGYRSERGVDLIAANPTTPANVGSCTIQVQISITADSNPGPEPFSVTSDVQLRNRLPGGVGCG